MMTCSILKATASSVSYLIGKGTPAGIPTMTIHALIRRAHKIVTITPIFAKSLKLKYP